MYKRQALLSRVPFALAGLSCKHLPSSTDIDLRPFELKNAHLGKRSQLHNNFGSLRCSLRGTRQIGNILDVTFRTAAKISQKEGTVSVKRFTNYDAVIMRLLISVTVRTLDL